MVCTKALRWFFPEDGGAEVHSEGDGNGLQKEWQTVGFQDVTLVFARTRRGELFW